MIKRESAIVAPYPHNFVEPTPAAPITFDVLLSEMWTEYREGQEDDLTDFQKEGNRW